MLQIARCRWLFSLYSSESGALDRLGRLGIVSTVIEKRINGSQQLISLPLFGKVLAR